MSNHRGGLDSKFPQEIHQGYLQDCTQSLAKLGSVHIRLLFGLQQLIYTLISRNSHNMLSRFLVFNLMTYPRQTTGSRETAESPQPGSTPSQKKHILAAHAPWQTTVRPGR